MTVNSSPEPAPVLGAAHLQRLDAVLADTDRLLADAYPGDAGTRQPVHTVYIPADRCVPALPAEWGEQALAAATAQGSLTDLAGQVGLDAKLAAAVVPLVEAKLRDEPIEDLRLDFEDGYGVRSDTEEDGHAVQAAAAVADAVAAGTAPPFVGIRFKSFEAATRARGVRTLDLFLAGLLAAGELPDGLVLTLPKVSTVEQVEAMVYTCQRLEETHGLEPGRLRFEVQVETPQLILAANGTVPAAQLIHRGQGRVLALHYGTYDYSDSVQIAAEYQSMEHPAADYAKAVMQVAAAGTGVRLSDGSTNILPLGTPEEIRSAWQLHARLVRRSLARGFYQGWDLHPAQLPTRFLATYAFYREGFDAAARRLDTYVRKQEGTVLDEPATARALARFVHRGLLCGALTETEIEQGTGLTGVELAALAHPKAAASPTKEKVR
ncbi:aldolase/citrate lyase family protein [Arthrobacter gengyunqii]|uniref:Aldolase n=1 Tax=Arthrobacter gengyunqii TaxID=2886940 RepID=A0A9X1M0G7_9MICC|nr:aldolase/citrate lyase family protein [Arthrobacter gengyunqii]MCC3268670.1 aldolase [Arthrobacter gengyunqii]UOY96057.1 aldolase/citrate lyase family protein [Arthrobacter gengyunqii]